MPAAKSALFLDRDGVVIQERGYISDASLVELIPGIVTLIRAARGQGMLVILVTNQSGIGRGWVGLEQYLEVSHRMVDLLEAEGAFFDHLFYAPFYMESPLEKKLHEVSYSSIHVTQNGELQNRGRWHNSWRKPELGMVEEAKRMYDLDLRTSIMIGDRFSDMELAGRANFKNSFLLKPPAFIEQVLSDQFPEGSERRAKWAELRRRFNQTTFHLITDLSKIDPETFEVRGEP